MPKGRVFSSKAQSAAMHAAAEGRSNIGIPQSVGKKLVAEAHGQKIGKLPQRVQKKASGGDVDLPPRDPRMELHQQALDMANARGQAAVSSDPDNPEYKGSEGYERRKQDIENYYDAFGENPSPGRGVLKTPDKYKPAPVSKARGGAVRAKPFRW